MKNFMEKLAHMGELAVTLSEMDEALASDKLDALEYAQVASDIEKVHAELEELETEMWGVPVVAAPEKEDNDDIWR